MRVHGRGRVGKPIYYRGEFTVCPVWHKDYEDFMVYEKGESHGIFDTLGAAIEYIRLVERMR